jgi:hypothetical protein
VFDQTMTRAFTLALWLVTKMLIQTLLASPHDLRMSACIHSKVWVSSGSVELYTSISIWISNRYSVI